MTEVLSVLKENPGLTAVLAYLAVKEIIRYFRDSTKKNTEATEINTRTLIRVETKLEHFEKILSDIKTSHAILEKSYNKHEADIRGYNIRIKNLEGIKHE